MFMTPSNWRFVQSNDELLYDESEDAFGAGGQRSSWRDMPVKET